MEFELWLESEHATPRGDPTDDFANVEVRLRDGRCYALNVWTYSFVRRCRFPWPYEEGKGTPAEYVLPPDLLVERLDRETLERVFKELIETNQLRAGWLSSSGSTATDSWRN